MDTFVPTASTSIDLSIWAILDAVHRSMVTLKHLPLLAFDPVDANPFVACAPGHKSVLPNWVDRRGRWCIGQIQAMSGRAGLGGLCGNECDHISRRHHESLCFRGKFHRGDRAVERYLSCNMERASIPPPHCADPPISYVKSLEREARPT